MRVTWPVLPVLPPFFCLIQIWSSPRPTPRGRLLLTWGTKKKCLCLPQKTIIVTIKGTLTKLNLFSGDGCTFSSCELRHCRLLLANTRRRAATTHGCRSVLGQDPSCSDRPECPHVWPRPVCVYFTSSFCSTKGFDWAYWKAKCCNMWKKKHQVVTF